jgi:flagellar motility protein MotE (MotC chaperone)
MNKLIRELRLIPVVLFAAVCLLALKVIGLVLDGGYTLANRDSGSSVGRAAGLFNGAPDSVPVEEIAAAQPKVSWAREMFNFGDVTGTVAAEKPAEKNGAKPADEGGEKPAADAQKEPPESKRDGKVVPLDVKERTSPAERALLERLGERRQELEARSRELEIRENLLKSAEKRIDGRVNELKDMETQVDGVAAKRDEASAQRFKNLVTMYESMKAKDAAKIFDRLEMRILVEVASQINPRRMSDILAQMQPEAAERLTVELANRASPPERSAAAADLPKIEGRPR